MHDQEILIRHIMSHHYDDDTSRIKLSAFETAHLKRGLSVTRKALLDSQLKQNIINELSKGIYSHKCDLEAVKQAIEGILHEGAQVYKVILAPLSNNKAHAEIKYSFNFPQDSRALLKQYRDNLFDIFQI